MRLPEPAPRLRWPYLAIAIGAPFLVFSTWLALDHASPISDAAEYLGHSYQLYRVWHEHAFSGLGWLYELRNKKPGVFPAFGALALGLAGGKTYWAIRLSCAFFYLLLLIFAFLGF